jgi:hypothetical protein
VRTAVLDAFWRASGGIVCWAGTFWPVKGPVRAQRAWAYPASPAAGEQVRFCLSGRPGGGHGIHLRPGCRRRPAHAIDHAGPALGRDHRRRVRSRTWSRPRSSPVLEAGSLSPGLIRDQIAGGGFTVTGAWCACTAARPSSSPGPGRPGWPCGPLRGRTPGPACCVATMRAGRGSVLVRRRGAGRLLW